MGVHRDRIVSLRKMRGAVVAFVTVVSSYCLYYCTHIIKMNISNGNENASAMLDELDATETESNDPFVMFDSMGPSLVTSHIPTPTLAFPIIPVRGSPTAQALQRLTYAKTEFYNSRVRFHAILRAPKPGSRHRMPLLGPQTYLTHNCWVAFHKYVKQFSGWKLSRRVAPNRCVANNKRKLYCIDAVYTHYKPQPLAVAVATPADSGSNNHIWNAASSTGNLQGEQPAVTTAASTATATATATLSGVLVDSTNVATCINTAERKPPAQTMTTVTPDAPPVAPTAAAAVAISSTAGMNTNQSPTPTATANGTTTTTTGHVLRYGDLVTFPLLHITPPTTLKAIVVQVYPADDDCAGKDKDEDKDEEDAQLVTVSTGPGERFTVPIHHLILIQPIAPMP
jgi:hypothetical protein